MRVDDFDFHLPPELLADHPVEPRDASKLFVYRRENGERWHGRFADVGRFLSADDLLVLNDTRVLPHRLFGRLPLREGGGGGRVECLILEREGEQARGYVKPARKIRLDEVLEMEGGRIGMRPVEVLGGGMFRLRLEVAGGPGAQSAEAVDQALEEVGRAPLPPYIHRDGTEDAAADRERYQTVFAQEGGAVAAPTAGLHFTDELLASLQAQGVRTATVTLHVGEGTFAPVRVDEVEEHRMHAERYRLGEDVAAAVAETRERGGRVIAVGTTSTRTLETCAGPDRTVVAGEGASDLFLYPGRPIRVVDGLITNFHLPQSTLLMLVAAFVGREEVLDLYREAIERGYRFYSFGDAMLLLP